MKITFPYFLKWVLLPCSWLVFQQIAVAQSLDTAALIQTLSSQVKKEFAPDKRVKVWVIQPNTQHAIAGYSTEKEAIHAFKKKLDSAGLKIAVSMELLPEASIPEKSAIVTVSVANLRFEPAQAAEMATQALMGTVVEVLKKQNGYFLVRTPDRYIAWVEDLMVKTVSSQELAAWQSTDKCVITKPFTYLYANTEGQQDIVSDVVAGNMLTVIQRGKLFFYCKLPDGRKGYVSVKDAMPYDAWLKSRRPQPQNIIQSAKAMLGTPYLWGGTSIKGVDCSGFVKTAFFLNGVVIPRDASQQVLVGEGIDIYENDTVSITKAIQHLQSGDLLFFSSLKEGKPTGKITHVAMYLSDGKFIHASGLVRINSMKPGTDYADWEARAFVAARRLTTAIGKPEIELVATHPSYNK